jgi:4-amino-4-deoxy-L-arabinose transferase-like glycosyltransferase
VIVAFAQSARVWWAERGDAPDVELQFRIFACSWLTVPLLFFSISRSKLPGYILPALPAGVVLLSDYLRQQLEQQAPLPKWMAILHALIASTPIVPAVLLSYIITEHRLPAGRPLWIALAIALVLTIGIALTLAGRLQWRMARFVTLVPVVLAVAAVLKLGTTAIDQKLSTRPVAVELASMETHKLPLAVCGVSREVEYGLEFYRDQVISRYEAGNIPAGEHLLIAAPDWEPNVTEWTKGRRVSLLGHYAPQNLDYYWMAAAPTSR